MARLNEVPAPAAETLESVKRRFIRQNREIARVNSNQSVRIRNLETEISRLLAENIALREDAINARAEAEKYKASHRLSKEVLRIKEQFEEKLFEVGGLVEQLGLLPEKVARRSSQRRRKDGFVSELIKATEDREPRLRRTNVDPEGVLPAILEDKYYPRRTLDPTEIQAIRDDLPTDSLESPDLGPPPVAHFEEPDVSAFDATKSPRRTSTELIEETEKCQRPSITSLESRRKRRTSMLPQSSAHEDQARPDSAPPATEPAKPEPEKKEPLVAPRSILKTGAKRKLELSELEDTTRVSRELDDFIFQRKTAAPSTNAARPSRFSRPPGRQEEANPASKESTSPEKLASQRRILAPKSTNSPAKRRVGLLDKPEHEKVVLPDPKPERRIVSRVRTRPAMTEPPLAVKEQPALSVASDVVDTGESDGLPPKTPAGDLASLLSPASTEPSTKQKQQREMAITNSVEDVLNGSIGRGSRRARAAVSYAMPKGNVKLRRDGEMVGAVEGLKKLSDVASAHARSTSGEIGSATAILPTATADISLNGAHVSGGKSEPASPLRDKLPQTRQSDLDEAELTKAVSRLSVFDHPSSSPVSDAQKKDAHELVVVPKALKSRRHSVQSRPGSALEIRQAAKNAVADAAVKGHTQKAASVSALPSATQLKVRAAVKNQSPVTDPVIDPDEETLAKGRSSALTRRRSMMV